ncbi:MAG: class IV adenylate cyclase [Pirellulaceae bacterium]|nr:class IV adenylate cyclase [Pirellulaceae bacterium]
MSDRTRPGMDEILAKLDQAAESAAAVLEVLGCRESVVLDRVLRQKDTYFRVNQSRLKLREMPQEDPELIWYRRPNVGGIRTSQYRRLKVTHVDRVKADLSAVLGVEAVVVKSRRLYRWRNFRIHVDQVDQLGNFIEFEAVLSDSEQIQTGEEQLEQLRSWLDLERVATIATSYLELLLDGGRISEKPKN